MDVALTKKSTPKVGVLCSWVETLNRRQQSLYQ